jgi:hypothetical protein
MSQDPLHTLAKSELLQWLATTLKDVREAVAEVDTPADFKRTKWPTPRPADLRKLRGRFVEARRAARTKHATLLQARRNVLAEGLAARENKLRERVTTPPTITPSKRDSFILSGRVTDKESGVGLPNVRIKVFDTRRQFDDVLGGTRSDQYGYYHVEYSAQEFPVLFDKKVRTAIEVLDDNGKPLYTSRPGFVPRAGKHEVMDAAVDGGKLEASLTAGGGIQRLNDGLLNKFSDRQVVLKGRILEPASVIVPPGTRAPPVKKPKAKKKVPTRPAKKKVVVKKEADPARKKVRVAKKKMDVANKGAAPKKRKVTKKRRKS